MEKLVLTRETKRTRSVQGKQEKRRKCLKNGRMKFEQQSETCQIGLVEYKVGKDIAHQVGKH